jgi:hypothetical protein
MNVAIITNSYQNIQKIPLAILCSRSYLSILISLLSEVVFPFLRYFFLSLYYNGKNK